MEFEFARNNQASKQIFAGKMLAVVFISGNLFLRIAEKVQELEPAKSSCHTVHFVRSFKGHKYFCWIFCETLLKSWRDYPFNFPCAAA